MLLSQHFIIIQSDQDLCPLTKLMDTIKYMNGKEQSREDPYETLQMHRLILTFAIRMQELVITRVRDLFVLTFSIFGKHFSRQHFEIFSLFSPENRIRYFMQTVSLVEFYFLGKKVRKITSICRLVNLPIGW